MTAIRTLRAIFFQVGALLLVFGLLGSLMLWRHWPVDPPPPVRINVRWTPETGEAERRQAETVLGLLDPTPIGRNGWQYTIVDTSPAALSRIVGHPAAEDTHGIDRSRATLVSHDTSDEAQAQRWGRWRGRLDRAREAALEQPSNWVLFFGLILAMPWFVPAARFPSAALGDLPEVSASGFAAYRVILGLGMTTAIFLTPFVPELGVPGDLQRSVDWFAQWPPIPEMVAQPDVLHGMRWVAMVGFLVFAAGLAPRAMWIAGTALLTILVLARLRGSSSHDWGLPLVAAWGLTLTPWGSHVPADARRRAFAIWLPGVLLGLAFCAAAVAKLHTSGLAWVTTGAVRYHFVEDAGSRLSDASLWIASHEMAAIVLSAFAIILEMAMLPLALVRDWRARVIAGLVGAGILTGFILMQSILWPAWWVLLAAFVPWDRVARTPARGFDPVAAPLRLSRGQTNVLSGLFLVQVAASTAAVELEPFISNFPMYSNTYPSPEAFNAAFAKRSRDYLLYAIDRQGCAKDVTRRALDVPNLYALIVRLAEDVQEDRAVEADSFAKATHERLSSALAAAGDEEAREIVVSASIRVFDFERGLFQSIGGGPVARFRDGRIEPSNQPIRTCER